MDNFDDAFGSDPVDNGNGKSNGNGFFVEDDVEADPAADFLAREQSNFAGLEDEIPVTDAVSNGDQEDTSNGNAVQDDYKPVSNYDNLDDDFLADHRPSSPFSSVYSAPREEPEKIKIWREEQQRRLEVKDAEEEESKEKLRAGAKKELDEWYKSYEEQIQKTRHSNRSAEQDGASAASSPAEDGKDWERIANLCDFNPKSSKQQKDISRMRSLILQLKQNPPARKQSNGSTNGS